MHRLQEDKAACSTSWNEGWFFLLIVATATVAMLFIFSSLCAGGLNGEITLKTIYS